MKNDNRLHSVSRGELFVSVLRNQFVCHVFADDDGAFIGTESGKNFLQIRMLFQFVLVVFTVFNQRNDGHFFIAAVIFIGPDVINQPERLFADATRR